MSPALLLHYLMLNVFRMLIHPSSVACDLFVALFHGLYCSGSMRVGVTLWFGWGGVVWCGIRMQASASFCLRITISVPMFERICSFLTEMLDIVHSQKFTRYAALYSSYMALRSTAGVWSSV